MFLTWIVLFINLHFINGEEDSLETKYIDLLPESEKINFIEKIARRIIEEVDVTQTGRESGEIPDTDINLHSEYVKKLLKQEAENLRRKTGKAENNTKAQNESKLIEREKEEELIDSDKQDNKENQSNKYVHRTIKDRGEFIVEGDNVKYKDKYKKPIDLTLRGGKNIIYGNDKRLAKDQDDPAIIEVYESDGDDNYQNPIEIETVTIKNYPDDKTPTVSIEIEIIGKEKAKNNTQKRDIPVKVVYDDENKKQDQTTTVLPETTTEEVTKDKEMTLPFEIEIETDAQTTFPFEIETENNDEANTDIEVETITNKYLSTTTTNIEILSNSETSTVGEYTTYTNSESTTKTDITTETSQTEITTTTDNPETTDQGSGSISEPISIRPTETATVKKLEKTLSSDTEGDNSQQPDNINVLKNYSFNNSKKIDINNQQLTDSDSRNKIKLLNQETSSEKDLLNVIPFSRSRKNNTLANNLELRVHANEDNYTTTLKRDDVEIPTVNPVSTESDVVTFIPMVENNNKEVTEINNTTTHNMDIIDKNYRTESTLSDNIKLKTQYITGYEKFEITKNSTSAEEIVQARTEFITGKYDSDISEEITASRNNINEILNEESSNRTVSKLRAVDFKNVNTTAIPMEPEDSDSLIYYVKKQGTVTPLSVLTTTSNVISTIDFFIPLLKSDNSVVFKSSDSRNDDLENITKAFKNNGLTHLRGNNKEYRVVELLPGEQPFIKVKPPAGIKFADRTKHNLNKDHVHNHNDERVQIEQPGFAPLHNYAPEYVYYNPVNRYGPNQEGFIDGEKERDKSREYNILGEDREKKKIKENFRSHNLKGSDNKNVIGRYKELVYFFGVKDRQKEELRESYSEKDSKWRDMKIFPNLSSAEYPYNVILNDKSPKTQVEEARQILHNQNYFGYRQLFKTTTAKIPTFTSRFPNIPPTDFKPDRFKQQKWLRDENIIHLVANKQKEPEILKLLNGPLQSTNRKPNKGVKVSLVILNGNIPNKEKKLSNVLQAYFDNKNKNADANDASEELKPFIEYNDLRKRIDLDRGSSEYPYYSDPGDISSGDVEAMKTLNTEAIELVLNLTDTKQIFPILQQLDKLYNESMPLRSDNSLKLQSYVQVLQDMIRINNKALENYDWLSTSVDIRSAIRKLLDLSHRLKRDSYIHPKDLQLLKYMMYLHNSVEEFIEVYPAVPPKRLFRRYNSPLKTRPWLVRSSTKAHLDSFEKFWMGIEYLLDDFHDAIKHIAMITSYTTQKWFSNLQEIYLYETSRKQALEILLHLTTANLIGIVEDSSGKGLNENYVKYAMSHNFEVEKAKDEMEFLVEVYNALKKEIL